MAGCIDHLFRNMWNLCAENGDLACNFWFIRRESNVIINVSLLYGISSVTTFILFLFFLRRILLCPQNVGQNFNIRHAWEFFSRLSLSLRGRRKVLKFITTFTTVHGSVLSRSNCIIQVRTKLSWQNLHPTSSFSQYLLLFSYED
jgi:hypothetical protein